MSDAALGILTNLLGSDRVSSAAEGLVVRPSEVDDVCRIVKLLTDLGVAVVPRGGGTAMSEGTRTHKTPAATVDLRDLNRIVEINENDRTVTVEAGCTWAALASALRPRGLRTPFFGPLGSASSTVGGTVSGNAWFFGSATYGTAADNVLGVDVVLANGSLVQTGAAAGEGRSAFIRHFGPDFGGVFLGDCGAFGVKVRITLPLIPLPAAEGCASFAFERFEDIAEAHVAIAREHVAAEQWGLDPEGNDALAAKGYKFLEGVTFAHDPSPEYVARTKQRLVDGRRETLRGGYSLHVTVEGASEREVDGKLGRVRRLLMPIALKELPNTIAQLVREKPFGAQDLLVPTGANVLPVHGMFPFSKASTIVAMTDEYFLRHREAMAAQNIQVTSLTGTAGNAFVLEAALVWKDAGARETAERLRRDLIGLWDAFGASHMQLGRIYPFADALSSAGRAMAEAIKQALDPRGLMNPGALQLGSGTPSKISRKFAEFPQNLLDEPVR